VAKHSKKEHKLKRKRLRILESCVGRWIATLTNDGNHEADVSTLTPELRAVLRAHDRCDWAAITEDCEEVDT
jgi:hypothetical protein